MSGQPDLKPAPRCNDLGSPELREDFKHTVLNRDGGCKMGGLSKCGGELQACHLIPKQRVRRLGFGPEVVYDPRSAICGCLRHHNRNDNYLERFPRCLISPAAWDFYAELDLTDSLERAYPVAA